MNRQMKARDRRSDLRVPVDILLNKYLKGRPYLCRASNLSEDGVMVHGVTEPQSTEVHVGLQFQLPGTERVITCSGQVVHEHGWSTAYGIRFTHISPQNRDYIQRYVHQRRNRLGSAASPYSA